MPTLLEELLQAPVDKKPQPTPDLKYSTPLDADGTVDVELPDGAEISEDEWEVVGRKSSTWQTANGKTLTSNRLTLRPKPAATRAPLLDADIEKMFVGGTTYGTTVTDRPSGEGAYILAMGDMQYSKADGDGVEGTVRRVVDCLDKAALRVQTLQAMGYPIGHVHNAWLGDHVEGFESQGGANAWRTTLTLTEQIRLVRRTMMHALGRLAPLADRVTMAALPGNHGEAVRFNGKGVTRYDDSHDTESLIAIADMAKYAEQFKHVEFYVPQNDELTVFLDVAGLPVLHHHGHKAPPGKALEFWKKQAFHHAEYAEARLFLTAHYHHAQSEASGERLWWQVQSFESVSKHYELAQGETGDPGMLGLYVHNGKVQFVDYIR